MGGIYIIWRITTKYLNHVNLAAKIFHLKGHACVMTYMGKESKKEWIYVQLIHFAVQQKLTQHCKSTILQSKKKKGRVCL